MLSTAEQQDALAVTDVDLGDISTDLLQLILRGNWTDSQANLGPFKAQLGTGRLQQPGTLCIAGYLKDQSRLGDRLLQLAECAVLQYN